MLKLRTTDRYETRARRYRKKKTHQLTAVLSNLQTLQAYLESGKRLRPLAFGFLREEGDGVLRISEAGAPSNVAATRLYIYHDAETETLYLLSLGDKSTQSDDIHECRGFAKWIRLNPSVGDGATDEHEETGDEKD